MMLTIMQVSAASVFGQMGAPGNAGYCSSKAAVIGVSRTAAKENPHLRINCVSPGKFAYALKLGVCCLRLTVASGMYLTNSNMQGR